MDINNFGPFHSDVWGNFSDWSMVVVTTLTAIFLWKTLKSQTIVQGLQERMFKIEYDKHRVTIMPKFEIRSYEDRYIVENLNFELKCLDALAHIKRFVIKKGKLFKEEYIFMKNQDLLPNTSWTFSIGIEVTPPPFSISFRVEYLDVDGNEYFQDLSLIQHKDEITSYNGTPVAMDKLKGINKLIYKS
jgi:hypothetical protein